MPETQDSFLSAHSMWTVSYRMSTFWSHTMCYTEESRDREYAKLSEAYKTVIVREWRDG